MSYYIASLKHTHKHHEHITFWGPNYCGYTCVIGERIGEYTEAEALRLNDGETHIAVAAAEVRRLLSPEPYYKPGARFYDQRGPVVDNTREKWAALLAARLHPNRTDMRKPKPEVFKGKRRAIFTEEAAA